MANFNKTALFLIMTFTICFGMVGLYYSIAGRPDPLSQNILSVIYMFIPMISVLIIEKVIHKNPLKQSLGISFKLNNWFLVAWLIPPVLCLLTITISILFPGVEYSPDFLGLVKRGMITPNQLEGLRKSFEKVPFPPVIILLLQGMFAGITINAVAGFGEELGWRGFLLKELRNNSFWKVSLIIGFIWGIWHAPLILLGHNYPAHPVLGVLMMTIWCILLSPLFNYIRIKSRSVIAASIMHGTINGIGGIALMVIEGGNDLIVGLTGASGMIAIFLIIIFFYIYDMYFSRENIMNVSVDKSLI